MDSATLSPVTNFMINRNVKLDIIATLHIRDAQDVGVKWNCNCSACEYMRKTPKLVEAVYKAIKREQERIIANN